ncbi:response regulator [Bacteroides sp. OttesenSCG-928-F21]|nr:response regulator [Bacteroides sp. OttesenSCG-928-F21]
MKTTYKLLACILLFLGLNANAQTGKFYSTDKELSNSLINKVYQDRKGFVWVATENGLNKFDGVRFTIYKHNEKDPLSLKNNYVRTMYEDSHGNFWIGCINGLQLYDRSTESFSDVNVYRNVGKVNPHITSIVERTNGEVWMTTSGQGIIAIKQEEGKAFEVSMKTELSQKMNSIYLNEIFEDSKRNLWIATEDKGLFRYSPEKEKLTHFKAPENLPTDRIYTIREDRKGNIFVGTFNYGLFRLQNPDNTDSETFQAIPYKDRVNLNIKSLMINKQGTLLLGTDGDGLKIYNEGKNIVEDYEINAAPFDFSKSKVHSLLEDRDNNLWLGIFQKGIILIPGIQNKFNYYGYKSVGNNTIGSNCVMSICVDRNGTTWVGTDNDGLYGIDNQGKQLVHYRNNPTNPTSVPGTIMAICEDSNRDIWLGSYFNGLARIDARTGKSKYITGKNKTGYEKISCITEDNNRNLWIGTHGGGMQKITLKDHKFTYYESTRDENNNWSLDILPNDWINCILKGEDGLLWIGTYNGLACFNSHKNTFINYMNRSNLLPGYIVNCLLESNSGHIWVGTSNGLLCFDKRQEKFIHYTTEEGLPSEIICGMAEDEQGNIWISSHQGISKLIAKEGKFVNYYAADGLQGNEFSRGAVFKDNKGMIYFGGTNGVTTFYPRDILEQKKDLKVSITEFYIANQIVKKGDKSGKNIVTNTAIMDSESFTVAHNVSSFSMVFSVLEFNNPERITYQYKIEELDKEWVNIHQGINRVTFSNLNPGKYTFRVRASDHDNFSDIHTVSIVITPPWYQTTWAKLIWVLLGGMFIYAVSIFILSRIRHRQELMEREHQEQLSEAKLQFFINISHEIRTPMTLIISPLEKLLKEGGEKQPTYLMIYRNAQRILRLINQLMDIRKLDKGLMHLKFRETDIIGFIDDLMQTFDYQAKKKNITFKFEHKESELKAWVDLNNFDKVLLNVFSNAFKYTPENGEIQVKLTTGKNENTKGALRHYFEISITDSGIGIDQDKIEQIFERFYQINNDLTQSNFGTGIGLHLSRSLVELHRGSIRAESREEGNGTRFIIRLPMGSDHLRADELESPHDEIKQKELNSSAETTALIHDDALQEYKKVKAKTRYRVLVVEDEEEIRGYIRDELSNEYRISESKNGKEALDYILKEKPDLVISDVMMPEMDGITLSRKIKQNITTSHIPIVLLTARSKTEDRLEGLESGADAFIVKPFNTDVLRSTISNLISNRERLKGQFVSEKQMEEKINKIEKKSSDDILMEKIMKTINDHLADPELNVEMLAANVGLSRVHMYRKLKELTNQSARDFIRNIRFKQAASLLVETKLTVSEVAYATGFSNISHFSNSFKDLYGVSPTEYREKGATPSTDIHTTVREE